MKVDPDVAVLRYNFPTRLVAVDRLQTGRWVWTEILYSGDTVRGAGRSFDTFLEAVSDFEARTIEQTWEGIQCR